MLNGKFYTGLPPKMIDRQSGPNRQQSSFFWPDDTNSEPARNPRNREKSSGNTRTSDSPQLEVNRLFHNEFNKSKIEFCDPIPQSTRGKAKTTSKISFSDEIDNTAPIRRGSTNHNNASKIEFFDYVDELNNSSGTSRNLKFGGKPTGKIQNKRLSFEEKTYYNDEPDIQIITNDVKNIKIDTPKKILKYTKHDVSAPAYTMKGEHRDDTYRRNDATTSAYPKKGEYIDEVYTHKEINRKPSNQKIHYKDEYDDRYDYSNLKPSNYPKSPLPRHRMRLNREQELTTKSRIISPSQNINIEYKQVKVENGVETTPPHMSQPTAVIDAHKHLVSNIDFKSSYDNQRSASEQKQKRFARSNAVSRVTVGLPD